MHFITIKRFISLLYSVLCNENCLGLGQGRLGHGKKTESRHIQTWMWLIQFEWRYVVCTHTGQGGLPPNVYLFIFYIVLSTCLEIRILLLVLCLIYQSKELQKCWDKVFKLYCPSRTSGKQKDKQDKHKKLP